MDVTNIQETIEQLKASVFKEIYHKTLLKNIGSPCLEENYSFYILLPFLNGEILEEKIYEGAVTVGIVLASLAEHENISEYNATSKSQQLTVLSGDYFSGKYYELLANAGNIPFIRQLSEAILLRCEQMMNVYEQENPSVQEWFEILLSIETIIIEYFYKFYEHSNYVQVMKNALLIRRLQIELESLKQGKESVYIKKMIEANDRDGKEKPLETIIQQEIDALFQSLHGVCESLNLNEKLKQYILSQLAYS